MNSSNPLAVTERMLAAWAIDGASVDLRRYRAALQYPAPAERLQPLEALVQSWGVKLGPVWDSLALAVLADTPGWQEQVFCKLLLPTLQELMRRGNDITGFIRACTQPPLGLSLAFMMRPLIQCSATETHPALLLFLREMLGDSSWGESDMPLLLDALRFWNSPALVSVLLARALPAARGRQPRAFLGHLGRIRRILDCEGLDPGLRRQLAPTLAPLLAATADDNVPLAGQFLFTLLRAHQRICRLLDLPGPPRCVPWYQLAARCLEAFPTAAVRQELRQHWVQDLLAGWTGAVAGRRLIVALYRAWSHLPTLRNGLTRRLVRLFRSTPALLGYAPASLILPILEPALLTQGDPVRLAVVALNTEQMLDQALPGSWTLLLQARLIHGLQEPTAPALRETLNRCSSPVRRLLGQLLEVWPSPADASLSALLWEVLFSPPLRWPTLGQQFVRLLDRSRLGPPALSAEFLQPARQLVGLLLVPPRQEGEQQQ